MKHIFEKNCKQLYRKLVESTSLLMQILKPDWLSHRKLSAISAQWFDVISKMTTFLVSPKF